MKNPPPRIPGIPRESRVISFFKFLWFDVASLAHHFLTRRTTLSERQTKYQERVEGLLQNRASKHPGCKSVEIPLFLLEKGLKPFSTVLITSFIFFLININTYIYAQGITIPTGSSVKVSSGTLNVEGNIINDGTLSTTTGTIKLSGNWDNVGGTYTANTGTVDFTKGVGLQTLDSNGVGVGKLFYNLTHSGAGTLRFINNAIDIDGSFVNSAGTVDANALTMNVGVDWNNTGTFTHNNNTVNLDGSDQQVLGTTTFYVFDKTVTTSRTLTFDVNTVQTFANHVTLKGASGQLLSIRSTLNNSQARIGLTPGGTQAISYLDVKDSDASSGLLLVAGLTSVNSLNNTNWFFGASTLTWDGSTSTDWNTPSNWDLGFVPGTLDSAVIANAANQPVLATNVTVVNLTINSGSTLTLNGKNLTVSTTFENAGEVRMFGTETVTVAAMDVNSGKFVFTGDSDGVSETFTIPDYGTTDYFDLVINDVSATKDSFLTNSNITAAGILDVTTSVLDISTNTNTLTTTGTLTINGGTLTATNGNIDANGAVVISSGTLTAPTIGKSFTVAGNFTHSGGTFSYSSGTLTLDGTNQSLIGSTTFYNLTKVVSAAATLTFDDVSTQTVVNNLNLQGASGALLSLVSDNPGTAAGLVLQAGGLQSLYYLDVKDNNATGGLTLIARNSTNSLNNTNWVFGGTTITWDGSASTDWDTAANWDLGLVPTTGDTAVIPDVANQPLLATNVTIANLTIQASSDMNLNGKNLSVSSTLNNSGTVFLFGSETVVIGVPDPDSGTFTITGDGDGAAETFTVPEIGAVDYFNLTINDPNVVKDTFITNSAITLAGALNVTLGVLDISTNTNTLTTAGLLTVNGGTLTATNGNIDANGSVVISSGTLTAPGAGKSFTVADDWTYSGGTFTHSSGTVTLDSLATATIQGNTTFNNLTIATPTKIILFTNGTDQTILGTFTVTGIVGNKIVLKSVTDGLSWDITFPNGTQTIFFAEVRDSDANTNTINCVNCVDSGNNNPLWLFSYVNIAVPGNGKTVGQTPTVIGTGNPGDLVTIKDISNNVVATPTIDANGNFRVEVSTIAVGANSLRPFIGPDVGNTIFLTVVASPTSSQEPTITFPVENTKVYGDLPTITGQGKPGEAIVVKAHDEDGNLLLQAVGSGTVDGSGNYAVTLSTPLPKGINYLSVTVDQVASDILTVTLVDPWGIVFDTASNFPIESATVSLYTSAGVLAVPGVHIDAGDVNPYITAADGLYSFLAASGNYYMVVQHGAFTYPSQVTVFDPGRSVITGSRGETFTVVSAVLHIDHPMDSNPDQIRITKDANKREVKIGEIVTYTISITNLTTSGLTNLHIQDRIPPGFKFVEDRVILDGVKLVNPLPTRPINFRLDTLAVGAVRTLKYQLVVGTGVSVGNYENTAVVKNLAEVSVSNSATAAVKVVLDPLFDLGTVIGKIFWDKNENGVQDAPEYFHTDRETISEDPIPNVQLVTEDGTVITSDENGQFSLAAITPGRHLFRVDERTLPEGSYFTTDKAVIVDVTPGLLSKVNFGVQLTREGLIAHEPDFFTQKINLIQDKSKPKPRLNISLFKDEVVMADDQIVGRAEFRIFTNYSPFIESWTLEILDKDTKKMIRRFEGDRGNIFVPILWDGKNTEGKYIDNKHTYIYGLSVSDGLGRTDTTKEKTFKITVVDLEKIEEKPDEKEVEEGRVNDYRLWMETEYKVDAIDKQSIPIDGETMRLGRLTTQLRNIHIVKDGKYFAEVPIPERNGLTAQEVLQGQTADTPHLDELDVILPKGKYEIQIQEGEAPLQGGDIQPMPGMAVPSVQPLKAGQTQTYSKPLNIGEDYIFFVALGDAKVGYNFGKENVEDVSQDDKYLPGFYHEGKLAYFLKGKIKGKYLVTSSLDTERERKELFKNLDPDKYYPVYGDESSKDYSVGDTQGMLYLLVEWDKSSILWGNYNVNFTDTEFAQYNRTLYGGKIDLQTVTNTQFGDPNSKAVVFQAVAKQKSAHNEFLGTGGSLFYLKHKSVIEGSDKVSVEVRDETTGLVKNKLELKSGADYKIDYDDGRLLFWRPVKFFVDNNSIISNSLLDGDPVYVVTDYEYQVDDNFDEGSTGARVEQAINDYVSVGGTVVKESQETGEYTLEGVDTTVHVGDNTTIVGEFAQSTSEASSTFVSTDGGLTFSQISTAQDAKGEAYGLKGDTRLFNRLGLSSYYKYIGPEFSTTGTVSQQGKELTGFSATYDLTPVTRITATHEIQELLENGNLQTALQVGAEKTVTSSMQVIHEIRNLTLTGEYRHQEVSGKDDSFDTETNTEEDIFAVGAKYNVSEKIDLFLSHQATIKGPKNDQTTFGIDARPRPDLALRARQIVGTKGVATSVGVTKNVSDKIAVSGDYAMTTDTTGEMTKLGAVGVEAKVNDKTTLSSSVGVSQSTSGESTTTALVGGSAQVDPKTQMTTAVGITDSSLSGRGTSMAVDATRQVDEKTEVSSGVVVSESPSEGRLTNLNFGSAKKISDDVKISSVKTFGFAPGVNSQGSTYGLIREKDGKKLEGTLTQQHSESDQEVSNSNIFGLTGDINDRFAASGTFERGIVQNHSGDQAERYATSLGLGYVYKDPTTLRERIKASSKIEIRVDDGEQDTNQFLVYNSIEGRITPETSLYARTEFSNTKNTTTSDVEAQYKEIVLGGAYRPLKFDRLNLLARYTYLTEQSPSSQTNTGGVDEQRAHVLSGEAIFDLTTQWQFSEKLAVRLGEEKVEGFDFTKTRTWLMIHRINYNIDRNWQLSGEYRILTQMEAKDQKQGFMIEATRRINESSQLGIGYNFTSFSDDLSDLGYTAQGPFVRVTTALYDRTPEEIARAQQRILDEKINKWAWAMVSKELARPDSAIVRELNDFFILAEAENKRGNIERSHQIYKDIIVAGEMMHEEAANFIRTQVSMEETWQSYYDLATEYFKKGQYEEAKKLWEKILDETQNMLR